MVVWPIPMCSRCPTRSRLLRPSVCVEWLPARQRPSGFARSALQIMNQTSMAFDPTMIAATKPTRNMMYDMPHRAAVNSTRRSRRPTRVLMDDAPWTADASDFVPVVAGIRSLPGLHLTHGHHARLMRTIPGGQCDGAWTNVLWATNGGFHIPPGCRRDTLTQQLHQSAWPGRCWARCRAKALPVLEH